MKSEASYRISKKSLKLKRAFNALVRAILDHPVVERIFSIMLIIYLLIGFLGFAWMTISLSALLVSGFKSGGIADWLRDFVKVHPYLALVWLAITITTCWMFIHKEKKQANQNQPEPKVQ